MTQERIFQLLNVERACVRRACGKDGPPCNRDCGNCDLVQEDNELIEMYDILINHLASVKNIASNEERRYL